MFWFVTIGTGVFFFVVLNLCYSLSILIIKLSVGCEILFWKKLEDRVILRLDPRNRLGIRFSGMCVCSEMLISTDTGTIISTNSTPITGERIRPGSGADI